ncbi:MAG: hypothetical protein CMJ25_25560 [Phycisphaerae bacterium]|nr:hypothetical protein [Phycisphaerae bacterium]
MAEKPLKRKTPLIKRKEQELQNAEYEIPRGGGVVFMLPQKGVTIYDKENDTVREIRYCPNEPSIYVDEQSENAVRQSVTFRNGRLFVPKQKPNLKLFLDNHPANSVNGGNTFKEVNKKRDAEKELEKEFLTTDAVALVRDSDLQELLPIAMYFKVNINSPVSEIRYNLLRIAKSKPKEFIESFDSPQVKTRSTIQQAKEYQMINVKADGVYWFDSNSLIVSVPVGKDPVDVMVRFCLTERGASVIDDLEDRLGKLA